ncbi:Aste57867_14408 [Aphanomyces stellatus]|uniref:Aste57867_14408 protein n=1 Tax=Aphanomyces stellatus TaxID=120398 RepID=A0A485L0J2_9STRA|nr:hypothetical protein As57867_014354 [Aphanomyces stellatus]VFT91230.1 Aste57867_14408 [Aphanomyces stellatus]
MVKAVPELTYEVDPKVMIYALKFLNSAPKEKLVIELEITDAIANKVIDQRDFGGYKSLDDIFEKKLMRKKKFTTFRDRLLGYAKDNKPSPKADGDDEDEGHGKAKKGKKGKGGGAAGAKGGADALLALQKADKPVFKETEPLKFRCGYLVKQPEVQVEAVGEEPLAEEVC